MESHKIKKIRTNLQLSYHKISMFIIIKYMRMKTRWLSTEGAANHHKQTTKGAFKHQRKHHILQKGKVITK